MIIFVFSFLLIAATLASVCGLLGGFFLWADALNQAAPLWSLTGGLAAAVLAVQAWRTPSRIRKALWLGCTSLILSYTISWSLDGRSGNLAQPNDETIKIVSFNVWRENKNPSGTAAWLLAQKADIIVLLEVSGTMSDLPAMLSSAYPYQVSCRTKGLCSTRILSRLQPLSQRGLAKGDADNRKALSAALMQFDRTDFRFSIVALHMSRAWPLGDQRVDVDRLRYALSGVDDGNMILAGDFNASPWTATMSRICDMLNLRREPGVVPSWGSRSLNWTMPALLPLDHMLTGRNWAFVSIRRGPDLGSDHRPIEAVLTRTSR